MTDIEPKDEEGTTELEDEDLEDVAGGAYTSYQVESPSMDGVKRENC